MCGCEKIKKTPIPFAITSFLRAKIKNISVDVAVDAAVTTRDGTFSNTGRISARSLSSSSSCCRSRSTGPSACMPYSSTSSRGRGAGPRVGGVLRRGPGARAAAAPPRPGRRPPHRCPTSSSASSKSPRSARCRSSTTATRWPSAGCATRSLSRRGCSRRMESADGSRRRRGRRRYCRAAASRPSTSEPQVRANVLEILERSRNETKVLSLTAPRPVWHGLCNDELA